MARVMLLLGGNEGDVRSLIDGATQLLEERVGKVVSRSSILESEAWGFRVTTPRFLNQALELESELSPEELLTATQGIERDLGRCRESEMERKRLSGERYLSRGIDIDIILYDELIYSSERLTLPHPLMQEREFVLRPIVEIAPTWRNARCGMSCEELLNEIRK